MSGVGRSQYVVGSLDATRLPRLGRIRLRWARNHRRTGVLLCAVIRTPVRSVSRRAPIVALTEGADRLCLCGQGSKWPKWVPLEPGVHELGFTVARWSGSGTRFRRCVDLADGEVLVAVCEPVQPPVFYAKGPSDDLWYLGITGAGGGPARFRDPPGEPVEAVGRRSLFRRTNRRAEALAARLAADRKTVLEDHLRRARTVVVLDRPVTVKPSKEWNVTEVVLTGAVTARTTDPGAPAPPSAGTAPRPRTGCRRWWVARRR